MLIADDFGLGRRHDEVILDLLEHRQIDGTSVMIDAQITPDALKRLLDAREGGAQIGLHLNLTHAFSHDGFHLPLGTLLRLSLLGRTPKAARDEFQRQTEAFTRIFGFLPDYYDGHQHCHCLPGLSATAAALPRSGGTWMRVPLPRTPSGLLLNLRSGGLKVLLVCTLAWGARRTFQQAGWPMNGDFSGFMHLDAPEKVEHWMPRLLNARNPGTLMMVHPGAADDPAQCPGHAPESRAVEADLLRRLLPL